MGSVRISVFLALALILCGSTCSLPWDRREGGELVVAAYNVHNLFDDVESGNEYPEFRPGSASWNAELYRKRLQSTAYALKSLYPDDEDGPDLICLSEVESPKVLEDLAAGPLRGCGYRWAFVGGPPSSPIRCALLSKLPIRSAKAHALAGAGFGGREILEVGLALDGDRGGEGLEFVLFLCHWKSRMEGAAQTEGERRAAAALVAARLRELFAADRGALVLVCGDFNESPDEFERAGGAYPTAFMPASRADGELPASWRNGAIEVAFSRAEASSGPEGMALFSPWEEAGGWSYVFKGQGERLDGFLASEGLVDGRGWELLDFKVGDDSELFDEDGSPFAWNGAAGFSDHLPLAVRLGKLGR